MPGGRESHHLGDHWACWPEWVADRPRLLWYLTFEDQPQLTEWVRGLAQGLAAVADVDPVPTRWLHVTLADVGFLDEVSRSCVDELADAAGQALDGWHCGPIGFGPLRTMGDAVVLDVSPRERLRELALRLRTATRSVMGPAPTLVAQAPAHMSIAYSRAAGHRPGLRGLLEATGPLDHRVRVPEVTLAAVTRRPPGYRWHSEATVPLGQRRGLSTTAAGRRRLAGRAAR